MGLRPPGSGLGLSRQHTHPHASERLVPWTVATAHMVALSTALTGPGSPGLSWAELIPTDASGAAYSATKRRSQPRQRETRPL